MPTVTAKARSHRGFWSAQRFWAYDGSSHDLSEAEAAEVAGERNLVVVPNEPAPEADETKPEPKGSRSAASKPTAKAHKADAEK